MIVAWQSEVHTLIAQKLHTLKALAASVTQAALERARLERDPPLSAYEMRQKASVEGTLGSKLKGLWSRLPFKEYLGGAGFRIEAF